MKKTNFRCVTLTFSYERNTLKKLRTKYFYRIGSKFSYFATGSFLTQFLQNCRRAASNRNDTDEF